MATVFTGYVGLQGPQGDNEGQNLLTLIDELNRYCTGGYTLTQARGRYDGRDELSAVVSVIAKHGYEVSVRAEITSALLAYKHVAQQEEVWLTSRTEDLLIL